MASDGSGGSWPTSLSTPETDELIRLGMMVPPDCRLPHVFDITADGYTTRGPGASPDELRRHEGGRWNIVGRARLVVWPGRLVVWPGRLVVCPARLVFCPALAPPSPSGGRAVSKLVPPSSSRPRPARLPSRCRDPTRVVHTGEDSDLDDCPGYLIALRASQAEAAAAEAREATEQQAALDVAAAMAPAAEAAELQAALDAAAAIEAVQPQVAPEEDDGGGGYWDGGSKSSDDGDGDDDGDIGAGEIIDLSASDDDE
ncbi:unnamed protein product [Triticum turgidum subsp. durum]|uniref:Uncharacterized protein n=1 Tax=Triticum turgidum subsp. durum TaxID=4567 RepID=A0A9R1RVW1_TRITD|nr:unnamed protein product [Triticum turgidum subsp. durum]